MRPILFTVLLLNTSVQAFSQIVDDSTKLLYGPRTTRFVTEYDILNNTGEVHLIDTSLSDFHNIYTLYKGKTIYQSLGNLGTALNNIYYSPPASIGKNFGFNAFDLYAFDSYQVKYFDTRSPYTSIYYIQGATGQQMVDAEFSRNILPNWNFGFDLKRMTSNKISGASSQRDRLADHTSFLFHTRFFSRDSTYQILANYSVMDHKLFETGGVKRDVGESIEELFDYRLENANLAAARSFEKRSGFHVYQQLSLPGSELLQLYHIFDYYNQSNRFRSNRSVDSVFFPGRDIVLPDIFIPTATLDRTDFKLVENKAGLKGSIAGFYYRTYYRRKDFYYKQYYPLDSIRRFDENLAGGKLGYSITQNSKAEASAEYLLTSNYLAKGQRDYLLKAEYSSPYLSGRIFRIHHSPTLLQLKNRGNNFQWNHMDNIDPEFSNVTSNNAYASGNLHWKFFTLQPGLNFSKIENYIYFDTLAAPVQLSGSMQTLSMDLFFKFQWKTVNLENFIRYTDVSRPDIIRVPEIYNHVRVYYQNRLFKKALLLQIGADFFWRSDYFADLYMPITQQFYLNNYFQVDNYVVADLFINAQIKRTNAFLRFSHINQGISGEGYFTTPFYPGLPRNFEFGLKWMFFD